MRTRRRDIPTRTRRIVFQLHLWSGLLISVYALFIGVTGALLMWRPELQRRAYPRYFADAPDAARLIDPDVVIANIRRTYPAHRFSAIEFPSVRRGTFLAYLSDGRELTTVFADPYDGRLLGELPRDGWIQRLQELHFTFLAGPRGYVVNGAAAGCLLLMCLTGIVIWWPGMRRIGAALVVHPRRGWRRVTWELHGAVGAWMLALLLVWSVSGLYFCFPLAFRDAIDRVAMLSRPVTPQSRPGADRHPTAARLIAAARAQWPGATVARLFVPSAPAGTYGVVLARNVHGDWDTSDEVTLYFDQYSGAPLGRSDASRRTAGDALLTWLGLLHVGSFGGIPLKIVYCLAALALPTLAASGWIMWLNRARPVRTQARRGATARS